MKKILFILRPFIFIAIGITFAITSAFFSLNTHSLAQDNAALASSALQVATPTPLTEDNSVVGSTDGITLIGFVIVAVVIVPVLFRNEWRKR